MKLLQKNHQEIFYKMDKHFKRI